jgi:TrmH family RNA methyltransferase
MITSNTNAHIKLTRALFEHVKARAETRQFVLDGIRLVADALTAGVRPDFVLYRTEESSSSEIQTLVRNLTSQAVPCLEVSAMVFDKISPTQTPQGIIAVCPWPDLPLLQPLNLVLILDQMNNPGNLGGALRTAAAVGVTAVILTPGSVDPFNPKVVRGAMGAHIRLPIRQWKWAQIEALPLRFVMADAHGTTTLFDYDWTQPTGLIVGSEAHGPGEPARHLAHETVSIPMQQGESLNATVAASVLLYEAYRQRAFKSL